MIKADEPERPTRSPSPARNPASTIVHVRNLVRPFTLNQLKELLTRHGKLIEESFWIDKIKSHCFASVSNCAIYQVNDFTVSLRVLHSATVSGYLSFCPQGQSKIEEKRY